MQTNRHDLHSETVNLTNEHNNQTNDGVDDWHSGSVPTGAVNLPLYNK